MNKAIGVVLAIAAGSWLSCDGSKEPLSTRDHLTAERTFVIEPEASQVAATVRLNQGDDWVETAITLEVLGGHVSTVLDSDLDRGDALAVTDFELDVDDLMVPAIETMSAAMSGDGLRFTGLSIRLSRPTPCQATQWDAEGDSCAADLPADLVLEWALVAEGDMVPIRSWRLEQLILPLQVTRTGNTYVLEIDGQLAGAMWQWQGIIEIAHIALTVRGVDGIAEK